MKIILLIILLFVVAGLGLYVNQNPPRIDLSTFAPFSQSITPSPSKAVTNPKTNTQTLTPQTCSGQQLPAVTEGPYYKAGSPQRKKIDDGVSGTKLFLEGYVLDTNCKPITNAWIDFWQADSSGKYDNTGNKLRGHQFTDNQGKYSLETIIPGEYPGRTPHIHAKVQSRENSPILTVQIFIPGVEKNLNDGIFNQELLMDIQDAPNGKKAKFNFIINPNL